MNMFKPVKATTIEEYFEALPSDRKDSVIFLDEFIKKQSPSLKPWLAYNMLGYGEFPYKNYKKETINWPIISLANQKNYISIYICAIDNGQYIAEEYKDQLGKVSVGKSCIRLKKLEDLNLETLQKIIKIATKNPGLIDKNTEK